MKFNELPTDVQDQLNAEREKIKNKSVNTPYVVHIYNADGTRYFYARRVSEPWSDTKGNYMPFGGGSHWKLTYGAVQFEGYKNPVGERDYRLCDGKTYGKSANGTVIPRVLGSKKEVLSIIKQIGIFNLN
ncbi:MAG: hypothetical protein KAZ98_03055 [Prevotella sp.]|nr:hypothetical protein [Prevotella sp.]